MDIKRGLLADKNLSYTFKSILNATKCMQKIFYFKNICIYGLKIVILQRI